MKLRELGLAGLLTFSGCQDKRMEVGCPQNSEVYKILVRSAKFGESEDLRVTVIQEVQKTKEHDGCYKIEINNGYGRCFTAGGVTESDCPLPLVYEMDKEKNLCDYLPK